jgi:hypothetical protein
VANAGTLPARARPHPPGRNPSLSTFECYDPGSPVTPDQALERFLLALGIPIPNDVEAKSSLYRSLRADRRMLLLLDNAGISYSRVAAGITFPV